MAALCAKVELYATDGRVIVTDYAYGNTKGAVDAAAGALRRTLEYAYEESHPGCNGIIHKTRKA